MPFTYPERRESRRHGPRGYRHYDSYRPWVRDEFSFRCVYCLKRERWGQVTREFDIDHFVAQSTSPELTADYENLVYSCARCNSIKLDQDVPDPFSVLTADQIQLLPDGRLQGANQLANVLIVQLALNSRRLVEWRAMWMRIVQLARERDRAVYRQLMGFPKDIPNLARLRPPKGNSRPEGVNESYFAKRSRGELSDTY